MARKPRVHFPGALYHVMARGNHGQAIFKDDDDRLRYLDLLRESQRRFKYSLYAYVLMGNHVHHLIQIGRTRRRPPAPGLPGHAARQGHAEYSLSLYPLLECEE